MDEEEVKNLIERGDGGGLECTSLVITDRQARADLSRLVALKLVLMDGRAVQMQCKCSAKCSIRTAAYDLDDLSKDILIRIGKTGRGLFYTFKKRAKKHATQRAKNEIKEGVLWLMN